MTAVDQHEIRDGAISRDMCVKTEPPVLVEEELSKLSSLASSDDDGDKRPWTVVSKGKNRKSRLSHVKPAAILDTENEKRLTGVKDPVIVEAEHSLLMTRETGFRTSIRKYILKRRLLVPPKVRY
jgi:hypothetical protein